MDRVDTGWLGISKFLSPSLMQDATSLCITCADWVDNPSHVVSLLLSVLGVLKVCLTNWKGNVSNDTLLKCFTVGILKWKTGRQSSQKSKRATLSERFQLLCFTNNLEYSTVVFLRVVMSDSQPRNICGNMVHFDYSEPTFLKYTVLSKLMSRPHMQFLFQ